MRPTPFMPPVASPTIPLAPSATPKRPLRVLYADDMPELRDIVRLCLSRDGHEIECAEDGPLKLNRITADSPFDLVIPGPHMPNLNGLELVHALRERAYPGKIMVFSSELSAAIAADYRRLNVDRIVYKPVYPATLRQILAELFP